MCAFSNPCGNPAGSSAKISFPEPVSFQIHCRKLPTPKRPSPGAVNRIVSGRSRRRGGSRGIVQRLRSIVSLALNLHEALFEGTSCRGPQYQRKIQAPVKGNVPSQRNTLRTNSPRRGVWQLAAGSRQGNEQLVSLRALFIFLNSKNTLPLECSVNMCRNTPKICILPTVVN